MGVSTPIAPAWRRPRQLLSVPWIFAPVAVPVTVINLAAKNNIILEGSSVWPEKGQTPFPVELRST